MSIGELFSYYSAIIIALATVAIAFFTYTLWRATSGLFMVAKEQSRDMKNSIEIAQQAAIAAQQSAKAAEKSANALPAMERAYIFVEVRRKNPKARLTINFNAFCEVVIRNYGKTPARIRYVERFANVFYGVTPEIDINRTGIMPQIERIIISGGEEIIDVDTAAISAEKWDDAVKNPDARLLCYGLIQYEDIFGENHNTGWCWCFEPITTKDFHFLDHPNNYHT